VLASSGDSGVFSSDVSDFSKGRVPTFPASSPYVTSVGATQLFSFDSSTCFSGTQNSCSDIQLGEIVASIATGAIITSGSGFSNLFARPSYQNTTVPAYLAKIGFSATGRAYPDVVFLGHNVPAVHQGSSNIFDGTSASSPFFAAFVSLFNDIRIANGKPPVGFINPLLYTIDSSAFYDITSGNTGCSSVACDTSKGFAAMTGYDAASGLGSPNFAVMANIVAGANYQPTLGAAGSSDASFLAVFSAWMAIFVILQLLL